MLATKSWLREKNFIINEKKSNSKPVSSVSFLGYSVFKEGIAPDPIYDEKIKNAKLPPNMTQLQSFVGLANFYVRMIPDFATKMLPLSEIWEEKFRWERKRKLLLKTSKTSYVINLLYSVTARQRKQP